MRSFASKTLKMEAIMKFTFLSRFFKRRKTNEHNLSPKTDSARIERVFLNFAQKIRVLTDDSSDEEEIEANDDWKKDKKNESSAIFINAKAKTIFKWDGHNETSVPMVHTRDIDCKMFRVLEFMNSEEVKKEKFYLKNGYDYAWIKKAIDIQPSIDEPIKRFSGYKELLNYSSQEFVDYLKELGLTNAKKCDASSIRRYINYIRDINIKEWPNLRYSDCLKRETIRRNAIIKKFLELMN